MTIHSAAFERYRHSPTGKTTILRLTIGTAIVVACWFAATLAVIIGGVYVFVRFGASLGLDPLDFDQGGATQRFLASPAGVLALLCTFAGIWLGVWVAMRLIHREKLRALFGNSRRISWPGFARGLIAVLLTSLLTEICLYVMYPEIARGSIGLSWWLVFLVPVLALTLLQTSSEELLFRGYLMRGLAYRFRNPLIWAALPGIAFTVLHWNTGTPLAMNACVLATIGSFAALTILLVYVTGNLGAAMGAHFGNNLTGFLLISHEKTLNSFALFNGRPLDSLAWTPAETMLIAATGMIACALTLLLLVLSRSPLKVEPDLASLREADLVEISRVV
jgi:membrane protease YdiL (CAAX protease family)